jgi:hypothetical protein
MKRLGRYIGTNVIDEAEEREKRAEDCERAARGEEVVVVVRGGPRWRNNFQFPTCRAQKL